MNVNEALRLIAGFFILLSVALGWFVHPGFFLFTAFVGLNLLQSAFTRWCPMMTILRKAGVR
jgi:hypothetical protein